MIFRVRFEPQLISDSRLVSRLGKKEPKGAIVRERKEENNRGAKPRRGRWSQSEVARLKELYGLREDAAIARELNRPLSSVRKMAEKIFPVVERTGPWSEEEVERLKEYLGASKPAVIARILGRPEAEVSEHIARLAQIQRDLPWTRDELVRFKRIFGTRTDEDLAAVFGRSLQSIRALAAKHALAKDKAFKRRLEGEASTRMPRWSAEEVELLRQLYPSVANLEIAQRLKRTVKSVVSKAHNLELKKSNERLKEMGRQNVSLRYQDEVPQEAEPGAGPETQIETEPVVEIQAVPRQAEPPRPPVAQPGAAAETDAEAQDASDGSDHDLMIPRPAPTEPRTAERKEEQRDGQ